MTQSHRITGGQIDRTKTLRFTFDGLPYQGHPGDTLASALLANGPVVGDLRRISLVSAGAVGITVADRRGEA